MVRWRKVVRDLRSNKARTVLVILSIAVAVGAVGAILATYQITGTELADRYAETNPADATLFGAFDEDIAHAVRGMRGVEDTELRYRSTFEYQTPDGGWSEIRLNTLPDYEDSRIATVSVEEGASAPRRREIFLERVSMAYMGLSEGEPVTIRMRDGETYTLTVAGSIYDMWFISPEFEGATAGYVNRETLDWMGAPSSYTQLLITYVDGSDRQANFELTNTIEERLKNYGVDIGGKWVPEPGEHFSASTVEALLAFFGAMAVLALLLAGLLVINNINATLVQQKRQMGIMKSVGAVMSDLLMMYIALVMTFGLFSLVFAVPLGALGAYGLETLIANILNYNQKSFPITPLSVGVQVIIALLLPAVSAAVPIFKTTRVTVREAINDYGINTGGTGIIQRLMQSFSGLSRPILYGLRNTSRRLSRLSLTLITLTLAGAVFIGVFTVRSSLEATVEQILGFWGYQVQVRLGGTSSMKQAERALMSVEGVETVEGWYSTWQPRIMPDGSQGEPLTLIGLPAETVMLNPTILRGRWLEPDDQNVVVINQEYLKYVDDLDVGDTLTLEFNSREIDFLVVGITKTTLSSSVGYINYPYLTSVEHRTGAVHAMMVQTSATTEAGQVALAENIEETMHDNGFPTANTNVIARDVRASAEQFDILIIIMLIMALILLLVGGLGLMGTMGTNVMERTREIGILRSIGADNLTVQTVVIIEAVLISVVSWGLGVILSLPIGKLLSYAIGVAFLEDPLIYRFSPVGVFVWLITSIGIALVASVLPARHASRISIRETLAYE